MNTSRPQLVLIGRIAADGFVVSLILTLLLSFLNRVLPLVFPSATPLVWMTGISTLCGALALLFASTEHVHDQPRPRQRVHAVVVVGLFALGLVALLPKTRTAGIFAVVVLTLVIAVAWMMYRGPDDEMPEDSSEDDSDHP